MSPDIDELATGIAKKLRGQNLFFYELLLGYPERSYREIMCAWSKVRELYKLSRDEEGRYGLQEDQE